MFYHLKEATLFTWKATATFFRFFWFGLVILLHWLRGFSFFNEAYAFLVPKLLIIVVGLLVTNIPLWLLIPISFLPIAVVGPVFFVAFVVALAH
jgi:hypothetical protein